MEKENLPYAVVQRLRLVDILLDQQGFINRGVLMEYFGISMPAASNDLGLYKEIAPNNMTYDLSNKTYVRTETFQRVWK